MSQIKLQRTRDDEMPWQGGVQGLCALGTLLSARQMVHQSCTQSPCVPQGFVKCAHLLFNLVRAGCHLAHGRASGLNCNPGDLRTKNRRLQSPMPRTALTRSTDTAMLPAHAGWHSQLCGALAPLLTADSAQANRLDEAGQAPVHARLRC